MFTQGVHHLEHALKREAYLKVASYTRPQVKFWQDQHSKGHDAPCDLLSVIDDSKSMHSQLTWLKPELSVREIKQIIPNFGGQQRHINNCAREKRLPQMEDAGPDHAGTGCGQDAL